jgi:hypothetical protein
VPKSEFKMKMSEEGKAFVEVHYKLALSITSATMVFSLELGGKTYGKVESKYE